MDIREVITTEYLIIGNSAGAIGAVEGIRAVDNTNRIVMVSDEPHLAYSRPLISKYLAGERGMEEILFRPANFYDNNRIDFLPGVKAEFLDVTNRVAQLADGRKIEWRKLLLATGGIPIVPKLKGSDKEGVFTFLTIADAGAVDKYIEKGQRAVVIGGGLIGISVAEALTKRGLEVVVVEMKDRILNTILDEEGSAIAEEAYAQAGVKFATGRTVQEIIGAEKTVGVILDNGTEIACNLVIIAVGVRPRIELALKAGIKVDHGILVDQFMATSHPDVYAAGDVAEAYDFIYRANRLTPIWPNAYFGGRVAGLNMAGLKTEYTGGTAMNSLNYFGLDIATAGAVTPPSDQDCEAISQRSDGTYKKVILSDNRIIGMVFVGDIERAGVVLGLMRDEVDVANLKEVLLADDFGLAYLPTELRRRRLGNASVVSK